MGERGIEKRVSQYHTFSLSGPEVSASMAAALGAVVICRHEMSFGRGGEFRWAEGKSKWGGEE